MKHVLSLIFTVMLVNDYTCVSQCLNGVCFPSQRRVFVNSRPSQRVVRERVVEQQTVVRRVPVVQENIDYYYFAGAPATLQYTALQQASYGQINRQLQRLQDQFASLQEYQEQYESQSRQYAPNYQAAPQAPQQQYVPQQRAQAQQAPVCPYCGSSYCPGALQQQRPNAAPAVPSNGYANGSNGAASQQAYSQQQSQYHQQNPQVSVLENRCAQCHTGANAKAGLDFRQQLTTEQSIEALRKTIAGEMPKDGPRLTDEEMKTLVTELFSQDELNQLLQKRKANGAQ